MCRLIKKLVILSIMLNFVTASAEDYIRLDAESSERAVCGLALAKIRGLVLEARAISQDSLRSRVDNERYSACPYWVSLEYAGKTMMVDFSKDFTLRDVREYDGSVDIRAGYFRFDSDGWHIASDMLADEDTQMQMRDSERSQFITGAFRRQLLVSGKTDFCVAIAIVGRVRFAVSSICASDKAALGLLVPLLIAERILQFEE